MTRLATGMFCVYKKHTQFFNSYVILQLLFR